MTGRNSALRRFLFAGDAPSSLGGERAPSAMGGVDGGVFGIARVGGGAQVDASSPLGAVTVSPSGDDNLLSAGARERGV